MADAMKVDVVSANRVVWEGEAVNVIARTTDGDIGILPGHEPVLAALVPGVAEVISTSGDREVFALDGGFLSVAGNQVSLLAQYATRQEEVSASDAQRELDELTRVVDSGDATFEQTHRYHLAQAQVKLAERARNHQL